MKRLMHIVLAQFFVLLTLLSSMHVVVNFHLCQETVKTYGVFALAPGCSAAEMQGQCPMGAQNTDGLTKKRCCANENFTFQEGAYDVLSADAPVELDQPFTFLPFEVIEPNSIDAQWAFQTYKPPNRTVDIQTSLQVFLI